MMNEKEKMMMNFEAIDQMLDYGTDFYVRRCNSFMGVQSNHGWVYVREHDGHISHGRVELTDEVVRRLHGANALLPARQ
jgi:hypothetical protein